MPKKKVILLMALLFFSMSIPALALQIGYVDFEFLFLAHPEYPIKSQEYRNILEQYVQEYQAAAAEITDGDELDNLITYYDTKAFEADEELSSFIVKSLKDFIAKLLKPTMLILCWQKYCCLWRN